MAWSLGVVAAFAPAGPRADASPPVTEVDWTLGCIATGSDEEVGAIAEFVRERRPHVVIR